MNKNRKHQDTEQEPEKEERPRREINKPHYLRDFVQNAELAAEW